MFLIKALIRRGEPITFNTVNGLEVLLRTKLILLVLSERVTCNNRDRQAITRHYCIKRTKLALDRSAFSGCKLSLNKERLKSLVELYPLLRRINSMDFLGLNPYASTYNKFGFNERNQCE